VQAFLLVAEFQSFTRAAEALGTTQAAVSMKLQRLESVLGKCGTLPTRGQIDR
jgi:DNA-binding transcriptional LysR family regulator